MHHRTPTTPLVEEPQPLPQFHKISPTLYECVHGYTIKESQIARPSKTTTPISPTTIVIFGWAAAPLRTVARFAKGHSVLFPTARILIALSTPTTLFFQTAQVAQQAMMPLAWELSGQILEAASDSKDSACQNRGTAEDPPRIILHAISNGGLMSLHTLSLTWLATFLKPLPHTLLVLDSCPGSGCFSTEVCRWGRAASAPLLPSHSVVGKVLGVKTLVDVAAVACVTALVGVPEIVTGRENLICAARHGVCDRRKFDPRANRVYIYSTGDETVRWQDVEASIEDTRKNQCWETCAAHQAGRVKAYSP